jgi:Carboxypeptidase regulatory-like domain
MRNLHRLALYLSFSSLLSSQSTPVVSTAPAEAYGSIRGSIVTNDGKPFEGATVYALPALNMRQQLRAKTDSNGKYLLAGVPPGEAFVSVFDEEKGYPYNFFSFFIMPGEEPQKVLVTAQRETSDVNFKLGEKAGRLQLEILDDSGAPITGSAQLVFTRPDLPGNYKMSAGDNISLLVPPVPFRLSINVNGFSQWTYIDKSSGGLLHPRSKKTIKLIVHLAPAEK